MIRFNVKKFLKRYPPIQCGLGSVAEGAWRRSKAMEVWDLSVGVLSEAPSHLNFSEKSCGLEFGRVG